MVVAYSRHGQRSRVTTLAVPLSTVPDPPTDLKLTPAQTTLTAHWQSALAPDIKRAGFSVYDVDSSGKERTGRPVNAALLTTPEFEMPIEFGKERCVAVRTAQTTGAVTIESDPVRACTTPVDTFAPPAPTNLGKNESETGVILTWEAVKAPDLAGYVVLRGDGSNDRLLPLTSAPIGETTYQDRSPLRPGVTYYYAVVAVDKATPPNRSALSNMVTVIR
jgi:hypothetical protein